MLDFAGYGHRRVTLALRRDGWLVNHQRLPRGRREEAWLGQGRRRFGAPTDSRHPPQTDPDRLAGLTRTGLDPAWVADLTYVRLPAAFASLAARLDASSRRGLGRRRSRQIAHPLTLAAWERARANRQPPGGLIRHAARGVQSACGDDVARLEQGGAQLSMAAVGNPAQNATAERGFTTLTYDEGELPQYRTFPDAETNRARCIEDLYQTTRRHASTRPRAVTRASARGRRPSSRPRGAPPAGLAFGPGPV